MSSGAIIGGIVGFFVGFVLLAASEKATHLGGGTMLVQTPGWAISLLVCGICAVVGAVIGAGMM